MGWQADLEEAVRNKLDLMSTPANKNKFARWSACLRNDQTHRFETLQR
jgi:hypothetical protein